VELPQPEPSAEAFTIVPTMPVEAAGGTTVAFSQRLLAGAPAGAVQGYGAQAALATSVLVPVQVTLLAAKQSPAVVQQAPEATWVTMIWYGPGPALALAEPQVDRRIR
jgi:hypothetical protein